VRVVGWRGRLTAAAATLVLAVVGGDVAVAATGLWRTAGSVPAAQVAAAPRTTAPTTAPVPIATHTLTAPVTATPVALVRPLTTLISPDLLLTGPHAVTAAQLSAVRHILGVTSVLTVSAGTVALDGHPVLTLGADPSAFRTVTPAPTASSNALWQSVAAGGVLATYETAKTDHLALGATVPVGAHRARLGSFAELRMPGVGAFVDPSLANRLGLVPDAGLVVTAPTRDVLGLERDVVKILAPEAPATEILRLSLPTSGHATMSEQLYKAAALTCPGLPWSVLAAIGGIESDHGADTAVSSAGAEGPMQFLPATFAEYAVDGDHDGVAKIDDPADAVYTAARMLCANGVGRGAAGLHNAVFAYNHAEWYVAAVLSLAARYAAAG
jgi:hypothetical protein